MNLEGVLQAKINRARAKSMVRRGLFDSIDWNTLGALCRHLEGHEYAKYYDQKDNYLTKNVERLLQLGLHRSKGLRILDVGCGFGYFLYAAERFGHETMGLDVADPLLNQVTSLLGLRKVRHRILSFQPLPEIPGGPFDLVTAFRAAFDRTNLKEGWGVREWRYFLTDVSRFMASDCLVQIKFNQYPDVESSSGFPHQPVPNALRDYFLSMGGEFDRDIVQIRHAPTAIASVIHETPARLASS